jgi:hypothetical protein
MQTTKTLSFDLFKNGIDTLAVQLYTMYTSNPNKETWSLDEIYQAKYHDTIHDRSKTMTILKNNLKWLKSKDAIEYPNNNSIKLVKIYIK